MPTVTKLEVQQKNKLRVNVYIDDEFLCGMDSATAITMGLKVGKEVSIAQLQDAIIQSEISVAFGKAVDYISRYMRTCKQLSQYLLRKGYSQQVVDCVVEKLKGYGYIDDARYAQMYVEQNSKSKGSYRLTQELIAKGVSIKDAQEYGHINYDDALANATALAEKYMKNKQSDTPTLVKLQRYLAYRGYDYDVINTVVNQYKN